MATTTATNSSQASPLPFPSSLLAGFPARFQNNPAPASASPSSTPISSTSTSSNGVFPSTPSQQPNHQHQMPNMFNPQYYTALMQTQLVQQFMKQYMSGGTSNVQDLNSTNADSRSPSTTTASPPFGQQQQQKKLLLDSDGNITCPICEQKIGPDLWSAHLESERSNLVKSIESLKENKRPNSLLNGGGNTSTDAFGLGSDTRKKRDFELTRIRSNQQKRLSMKQTLLSSTPMQGSQKFMVSSMCAPEQMTPPPARTSSGMSLRELINDVDRNFCKSCKKAHEFLIIASGLDEPRCMDCYRKYRRQVGALPLTITSSPVDDLIDSHPNESLKRRNGSHTTSSASPENIGEARHSNEDFSSNGKFAWMMKEEQANEENEQNEDNETQAKRPRMNFID